MTYPYKQSQPSPSAPPRRTPGQPAQPSEPAPAVSAETASEAKKWLIGGLVAVVVIIVLTAIFVSGEHQQTLPPTTPTPGAMVSAPGGGTPLPAEA